jgi:RNA polymerase sigma-70 factor (sigma-E family)
VDDGADQGPAGGTADDGGFEAFVAARWAPLVATAYLVTGDRGIAEDCVQEALVRLHRRWRRVNARGQVAYANRAVMNAALSWRRRRRVAEVPLNVDAHAPAQEPGDPTGFDPRLLAALWSLPPRTRAAVVLRFLEDRSEVETASILGCSVGTVKSLTSRGVARLRDALADTPGGEPTGTDLRGTDARVREGREA